jgi:DNA-binding transcriptional regulator YhcF (GntR family)
MTKKFKNKNYQFPIYKQLINEILNDIEIDKLQIGDRLPSINDASAELCLSRDTVERAYAELYRLGVITSILRKGYFISGKLGKAKTKIFLTVGEISSNNKAIINSFINRVEKNMLVEIYTYAYDFENFKELIKNHQDKYHYYIIIPHFTDGSEVNLKCLKKIAGNRLILIDQEIPLPKKTNSSVFCNYRNEVFQLMQRNAKYFKKYMTLNLIINEGEYFNSEVLYGIKNFCEKNQYEFQIINGFPKNCVENGNVYFTTKDNDLVSVIKSAENQNLELGKQVGLISLNDSFYNEILAKGISSISSKPTEIGKLAADIVRSGKQKSLNVSMEMVVRKSL